MNGKYSAFISYNHNPRDSRIALMLQKKLEHFKLPRGMEIQGQEAGHSRIERVFLDTGELGVSGDLNAAIMDALEHSYKLIVICSPESRESIWVQREIEFFLKSHDRRDILTVITDGEPKDVLPEAVLYEDVIDEDGQQVKVKKEPLSADYRHPLRKANAQELPRLVSAMIDCSYDDLVQRQRVYRMRRQIIITAVAAVFLFTSTAYLIWSNHQINANLERSLYEQALRLSSQSEQALNSGDRIGAVRYALDALPSRDNKKQPVTTEAVKALSDALGLYSSSHSRYYTAVRQYGEMRYPATIDSVVINNEVYLAICNYDRIVELWNASTGKSLMSDYLKENQENGFNAYNILFTDRGRLVIISTNEIITIDPAEEKEISSISFDDVFVYTDQAVINGEELWIPSSDFPDSYSILRIDTGKGKIISTFDINVAPIQIALAYDKNLLSYYYYEETSDDKDKESAYVFKVISTLSGEEISSGRANCITDICFSRQDDVIISGLSEKPDPKAWSNDVYSKGFYYGVHQVLSIKDNRTMVVSCIDPENGSELWKVEKKSYSNGLPFIRHGVGEYKNCLFCTTGGNVLVINDEGNIIKDFELESPVACFLQDEAEILLDSIRMISSNGDAFVFSSDDSLYIMRNILMDNIIFSCISKADDIWNIFILTDSTKNESAKMCTLTQYSGRTGDPKMKEYTHEGDKEWESYKYKSIAVEPYRNNFLEILCSEDYSGEVTETTTHLVMRNSEDGKILFTKDILTEKDIGEKVLPIDYSFCGVDEKSGKAYWVDLESENSPSMLTIDLKDGSDSYTDLTLALGDYTYKKGKDEIRFTMSNYDNVYLTTCRVNGGKLHCIVNGTLEDKSLNMTLVIDPRTGKGELSKNDIMNGCPCLLDTSLEKRIAVGFGDKMLCIDYQSGKELWKTNKISSSDIRGLSISEDGTLAEAEGKDKFSSLIQFFDVKNGKKKGELTIDYSPEDLEFMQIRDISDNEYLLSFPKYGYLIDKKTFRIRSTISGIYISYNPNTRLFLIGDENAGDIGVAPYRSLKDMIKEGEELLQ